MITSNISLPVLVQMYSKPALLGLLFPTVRCDVGMCLAASLNNAPYNSAHIIVLYLRVYSTFNLRRNGTEAGSAWIDAALLFPCLELAY